MNRRLFLSAAAGLLPQNAHAQILRGAVAVSGDRMMVDGAEYQLSDIAAPPIYHLSKDVSVYMAESKAALARLLRGGAVELSAQGEPNRWGVISVRARIAGQQATLQEMMISAGAARVSPTSDDVEFIDHLLMLEQAARAAQRGLWLLPDYRVRSSLAAGDTVGGFHLIEGVVKQAKLVKARFYLNFGDDYRTDFTAGTVSANYRRWLKRDFDMEALRSARVRIRGFVVWINGPSIDLAHMKQIEILEPAIKTPAVSALAPAQK